MTLEWNREHIMETDPEDVLPWKRYPTQRRVPMSDQLYSILTIIRTMETNCGELLRKNSGNTTAMCLLDDLRELRWICDKWEQKGSTFDEFIKNPQCEVITGLSNSARRKLERRGKFPKRIKTEMENRFIWSLNEVIAWQHDRLLDDR